MQTEGITSAQPASTPPVDPLASQPLPSAKTQEPVAIIQHASVPLKEDVDHAEAGSQQHVVQLPDDDGLPKALTGDSMDDPSPAATDEPRSDSPTLGTEEAGDADMQHEDARVMVLAEPEQLQTINHIQSTVDEEAAAMLAAAAKPDRQAQAQAEYERLKEQGAPANAK